MMMPTNAVLDEKRRLDALRNYRVLDTPRERALDDLTTLAATICETPIALISLVDEKRQWFKATVGLEIAETSRELSFCAYALEETEMMIVPDAALDARFARNALVTGEPHIRFYAGAPLVSPEGAMLGTLCVIDRERRVLTFSQVQTLLILARQVMTHLDLGRQLLELKASEANMAEGQRIAHLGSWVLDLTEKDDLYANAVQWSDEMYRIAGYEPGTVKVSNEFFFSLVPPEEHQAIRQAVDDTVRERRPYSIVHRLIRPDGEMRTVQETAQLFLDERTGELLRMVGTAHDITGRQQAAEALRMSDEKYHGLFEGTRDAIMTMEPPSWKFASANPAAVKMFGAKSEEELITYGPGLLSPAFQPDGRASQGRIREIIGEVMADSSAFFEWTYCRIDGEEFLTDMLLTHVEQGGGGMIHATVRDITERKRAEAKIREQAALLDEARDAICVNDLDQRILFWNKSAERLYGWSASEALGQDANELLGQGEVALAALKTLIQRDEWRGELEQTTREGRQLVVESRWTLIREADGAPKSILVINTDITEKKAMEAQFFRSQRMESIGTLAGGIAHDLNNALGPIILSLDLLRMKFPDHASQELLAIVDASAQRGADMVRQVLSFARGVEGRRMNVQVKHLIREIEKTAHDTFPKNIQVRTIISPDLWTVLGDPTQLHQVLLNLCVNARDAMPQGGALTLSAENILFDAHYAGLSWNAEARPGPYVLIQVVDTGTGMPPETIEKIFDPFFTTKDLGKGTGLGLSTSLAILKSHGGFIRVYSEMEKGTKFCAYLPAQTESSPEVAAQLAAEMPRGNGELILVVDDEAAVRQITQQTLEAFGYCVVLAADGADAVAIYAQQGPEIAAVLTDMMMPIMDGPASIQVLRRMNPDVQIIGVSGLAVSVGSDDGNVERAASLGIKHFLPKPYTAETLLQVLKQVLETKV